MTFLICDNLKKTKFVLLGATWKIYLGELAQHYWRQHLWDQTGDFGNGGFLAHPNSTKSEDESSCSILVQKAARNTYCTILTARAVNGKLSLLALA
jgi:hypothetical protein